MATPKIIGILNKCWRLCALIGLLIAGSLILFRPAGVAAQDLGAGRGGQISPENRHKEKRTFPDTTNRIVAFSDQFSTASSTDAQFQFAATHYAGAQKLLPTAASKLRTYNPDFLVMHYRLGEGLGYQAPNSACQPDGSYIDIINGTWSQEWPGDSVVKPEWFYQYAGQPRVYNCAWGWFLMNLKDPGWRKWWSEQIIDQLTVNEDDALFADSYSIPNYLGPWSASLPVVNSAFESSWAKSMHEFTNYIRARFHDRWLWIPNVGAYVTTRDPSDYTNTDGVMIEGFADYGNENFLAPGDWELQMNRALKLIKLDKILIAQAYPDAYGSATYERQFILASYLLVKGHHTYLNLAAQGGNDIAGELQWWPDYQIDLGPPTDPLPSDISAYWNANWGVYERHYQNGIVLVNPTSNDSGLITLPQTYYQVVGDGNSSGANVPPNGTPTNALTYQAVQSVDLAVCNYGPYCAAVLLNSPPQ
jgi:hypothetical protein